MSGSKWLKELDRAGDNMQRIRDAIQNEHGTSQELIARAGLHLVATLLRKNKDYGDSAFKPPALASGVTAAQGIRCRMSDKVERLNQLAAGAMAEVEESEVDTLFDLGGYSLLAIVEKIVNHENTRDAEIVDDLRTLAG